MYKDIIIRTHRLCLTHIRPLGLHGFTKTYFGNLRLVNFNKKIFEVLPVGIVTAFKL